MPSQNHTDSRSIPGTQGRENAPTDAGADSDRQIKAFNRRQFLSRGSVAIAAAGVVATVPGFASALVSAEEEAAPAESAVQDEVLSLTEPLVAHVRDLTTGEIGLFSGTEEIVFHDPGLATRLFNATR